MENKSQKTTGWFVLLNLVAYGIYAFLLSLVGGVIVWICLELGLSYEAGIATVLAFFMIELVLYFSAMRSPTVKATNMLLRAMVGVGRGIVSALPCALSKDFERDITRHLIRSTSKLIYPT